jgi:NAD(P)-dependent dehydrogenase (short-subunit alcohol dehydrogenase family)
VFEFEADPRRAASLDGGVDVVWLCSAGSSYITGTVIPIDGGQNASVKPPQMYRQDQPMEAAN